MTFIELIFSYSGQQGRRSEVNSSGDIDVMDPEPGSNSAGIESDEQMSQRIRDLEKELAALRAAQTTNTETPSTSAGAMGGAGQSVSNLDTVIYVQQDRKMPLFSGKIDGTDALTLDEWIEKMRDFVQTRGRTDKERAQIVFDHLEGAARTEIKYLPLVQRENVDCIFGVLKEVYGCLHSRITLQRKFYNRKQLEGESFLDYSHALMDLMDQVVKTDAHVASKDLRDQFCDGVRDQALRIRLRDFVNANPHWTIRDARSEATKWMAQYESQSAKYKGSTNNFGMNEVSASCESSVSRPPEYVELLSMLKAQQTQLDLVMKALAPSSVPPSRARQFRPRRTSDGKPICFRCEQSGHIARNCPNITGQAKNGPQNPKPAEN